MRAFACHNCGQLVFFENDAASTAARALGFDWPTRELLHPVEPRPRCANAELAACNWLVDDDGRALLLLRAHPHEAGRRRRARPARAPRRRGGQAPAAVRARRARAADRTATTATPGSPSTCSRAPAEPVTTGHADGVITLDLAESDDAHRVAMREQMGEPYRTVLGHLRHEIGHYYFPVLVERRPALERARASCSATSAPTTRRRSSATTPRDRPPGWRERLRERLRDHAPGRGLGRDLRPLPPHPRRAADRRAPTACASTARRRRRAAGCSRPAGRRPTRDFEAAAGGLAAAHLRAERDQPLDGPLRRVPVRALGAGDSQAGVRRRARAAPERTRPRRRTLASSAPADSTSVSSVAGPSPRSAARRAAAPTNSRNSGSGRVGRELNSGWNCEATKNGMVGQLDDLDQALVGRGAARDQALVLEPAAQLVVDLVAVAVALVDHGLAVDLARPGALVELHRVGAEAHRPAHVGDLLLLGQQVDHRDTASRGRTRPSWRRPCRRRGGRTRRPRSASRGRCRGTGCRCSRAILRRLDLALDAALAEAARDQDPVGPLGDLARGRGPRSRRARPRRRRRGGSRRG